MNDLVESTFLRYRAKGFPYFHLTPEEKGQALSTLIKYPHSTILVDGTLRQTFHGLGLAWSYFPHSWSVPCGGRKTPIQVFESDTDLRRVIEKRIKYGPTLNLTDSQIRTGLQMYSGTQSVSNFRPTAAAAVYHTFLPPSGGTVWDMSSGFGGRLLGAVACTHVSRYIGTDPCSQTMAGLHQLAQENERGGLSVELYKQGSEEFVPERESLDLCFSSPPYFDTEHYSNEPTQSYLAFPSKEEWLHGFLGKTIDNCRYGLKPDGRLVINIANVASYPTLASECEQMVVSRGWALESTLRYMLSRAIGTRKPGIEPFKYEPVFVFKKA